METTVVKRKTMKLSKHEREILCEAQHIIDNIAKEMHDDFEGCIIDEGNHDLLDDYIIDHSHLMIIEDTIECLLSLEILKLL